MIDFQIGFLTFIGLGDEEGKPKFGLTIKPNVKKYHTIQNVKINCKTYDLEKLGEKHILSKLLGQNDIDIIHNSMVSPASKINPAVGNITTVKLNINKLQFEENVMLLFYELATTLPKPENDCFQWFVGELNDNITEKGGYIYILDKIFMKEKLQSLINRKINITKSSHVIKNIVDLLVKEDLLDLEQSNSKMDSHLMV